MPYADEGEAAGGPRDGAVEGWRVVPAWVARGEGEAVLQVAAAGMGAWDPAGRCTMPLCHYATMPVGTPQ